MVRPTLGTVTYEPPDTITCVDCGGTAHLVSFRPHEGWELGDVVTYRCADCMDRWDLLVDDGDEALEP